MNEEHHKTSSKSISKHNGEQSPTRWHTAENHYASTMDLNSIPRSQNGHKGATVNTSGLRWPAKGTMSRMDVQEDPEEAADRLKRLSTAVRTIIECVGEDPNREGIVQTPERYAKALMFLTQGYHQSLHTIVNDALFQEDHGGMIIVQDIEMNSLCEHHMVPFTGKVSTTPASKSIDANNVPPASDTHRLRAIWERCWTFEAGQNCRHVCSTTAGTRADYQTSSSGSGRASAAERCGGRDRVYAPLYGDARRAEEGSVDDDELYARLHEDQPRGEGRVFPIVG